MLGAYMEVTYNRTIDCMQGLRLGRMSLAVWHVVYSHYYWKLFRLPSLLKRMQLAVYIDRFIALQCPRTLYRGFPHTQIDNGFVAYLS